MKQRDPLTALLLALFVPFYPFYWFYKVTKEVWTTHNVKLPSIWLLFAPTLLGLFFWPTLFIASLAASSASEEAAESMSVIFILLGLIAITVNLTLTAIYMYRFCKAIRAIVDIGMTTEIMFVLVLLFSPIVIYMVQEKLNLLGQPVNPQPLPPSNPVS